MNIFKFKYIYYQKTTLSDISNVGNRQNLP